MCDLDQDRLAGRRGNRLDLDSDHLDPFTAETLAFQAAMTELRAQAVERRVKVGEVDRSRHAANLRVLRLARVHRIDLLAIVVGNHVSLDVKLQRRSEEHTSEL